MLGAAIKQSADGRSVRVHEINLAPYVIRRMVASVKMQKD
jgi:hypothetical protein